MIRTALFIPNLARPAPPALPAKPAPAISHLFVYGSMRRGLPASSGRLPAGLNIEEGARIHGLLFRMYKVPIAVLPAHVSRILARPDLAKTYGYVHGDLVRLPADEERRETLLAELDRFEGASPADPESSTYRRLPVAVYQADMRVTRAWAYVAPAERCGEIGSSEEHLPSGDWLHYVARDETGDEAGGSIAFHVRRLISINHHSTAREVLVSLLSEAIILPELPELIYEWLNNRLAYALSAADLRNWNDHLASCNDLLSQALGRLTFSPHQAAALINLLEQVVNYPQDKFSSHRCAEAFQRMGDLLLTRGLRRAMIWKYLQKWLTLFTDRLGIPEARRTAFMEVFSRLSQSPRLGRHLPRALRNAAQKAFKAELLAAGGAGPAARALYNLAGVFPPNTTPLLLSAAGEEAVDFARRELHLQPQEVTLIFLEGLLWAAQGTRFSRIKSRLARVVEFYRTKVAELAASPMAMLTLRKGFEVEWWPRDFTAIDPNELPNKVTTCLRAFNLLITEEGYGEYSSFPSQGLELQVHILELIRRLGLFSPNFAVSLHVNLGLPFEVPYYLEANDPDCLLFTKREHPELYEALSLIWFPLGLLYMSDARWGNMYDLVGQPGGQKIREPFRFHEENVFEGDSSRLEYRVFEIQTNWHRDNFVRLTSYLHHLTLGLFWKEFEFLYGTAHNRDAFLQLGSAWHAYESRMGALIADTGLQQPPNYFSVSCADRGQVFAFQEQVVRFRRERPNVLKAVRGIIRESAAALDQIIGLPYDLSLPMPPPLFRQTGKFLV